MMALLSDFVSNRFEYWEFDQDLQGHVGAEVDARQDDNDDLGQEDSVRRDFQLRVDLGNPR